MLFFRKLLGATRAYHPPLLLGEGADPNPDPPSFQGTVIAHNGNTERSGAFSLPSPRERLRAAGRAARTSDSNVRAGGGLLRAALQHSI